MVVKASTVSGTCLTASINNGSKLHTPNRAIFQFASRFKGSTPPIRACAVCQFESRAVQKRVRQIKIRFPVGVVRVTAQRGCVFGALSSCTLAEKAKQKLFLRVTAL